MASKFSNGPLDLLMYYGLCRVARAGAVLLVAWQVWCSPVAYANVSETNTTAEASTSCLQVTDAESVLRAIQTSTRTAHVCVSSPSRRALSLMQTCLYETSDIER